MYIPAQIHIYEGARPRALPEGLGFPVEKIEDMSAGEAEEHIAAPCGPTALPVRKAPTRTAGPIGDRR